MFWKVQGTAALGLFFASATPYAEPAGLTRPVEALALPTYRMPGIEAAAAR